MKNTKIKLLFFILFFCMANAENNVPRHLFKKYLPDNPVIIEAGAHFGEDTVWMSKLWPQGVIYAFEPSPASYAKLKKVSLKQTNIHCFNLALSDKSGIVPFYISSSNTGGASSLSKPTIDSTSFYSDKALQNPEMIKCMTVKKWAQRQKIEKIDFLWLDMEGNELNALKSLEEIILSVRLIFTEINFIKMWENTVLYEELKKWLGEKDFTEIWQEMKPHKLQGNALFINNNYYK